jgi:hypothetical protein
MPTDSPLDVIKPYSLWVLTGFALGYKLVPHPQLKRVCLWKSPDGITRESLKVQMSSVNSLFSSGFLNYDEQTKQFKLSNKGFDSAYDRIRKTFDLVASENFVG